jgi:hypothetical protein
MKTCPSEKLLFDSIESKQPSDASLQVKEHLECCDVCRTKYNELLKVETLLMHRQRIQPSKEILRSYHQNLKQAFAPEPMWIRIRNRFEYAYHLFIDSRPLGVRLARGMALLLIGIFIGKVIFQPIDKQDGSSEKPSILTLTMSPTDVQFITEYITQSEIWLLAVANIPSTQNVEKAELLFNKEVAQRLLIKTSFMEERKQQIDSELLTKFLNRFELLLLEVANASDEKMVDISNEIKLMIENSTLLHETKQLREMFEKVSDAT